MKKIQMLGDGVRAVLFEWTHMPKTQAVYSELALGVELKAPVCDEVAMRAMVSEKYGVAGRLGFLEKGMSRTEILSLLGKPVRSSESELVFEHLSPVRSAPSRRRVRKERDQIYSVPLREIMILRRSGALFLGVVAVKPIPRTANS